MAHYAGRMARTRRDSDPQVMLGLVFTTILAAGVLLLGFLIFFH